MKTVAFLTVGGLLFILACTVKSDVCDTEIAETLKILITPQDTPSIQLQALRRDLLRKLQTVINEENDVQYPFWDVIIPNKRNLAALAREGYLNTTPESDQDSDSLKRGLDNLAKNNQLQNKRGIGSLARNGELQRRHLLDYLDQYGKRNVGSLAKNYDFPKFGKRFIGSLARNGDLMGKRSVASLAKQGRLGGKRNVAALLRQDNYMNEQTPHTEAPRDDEKRNVQSIKAQYPSRFKRQIDYYDTEEYSPVYQNSYDYDDFMGAYTNPDEKRFLGSVAKSGWFRQSSPIRAPDKRHIGALARLGWLPTLRNVRRFNRSGRSAEACRETAADGQTEANTISQDSFPLDEDKRFLLQPAVDQILLKKFLMHYPRSHQFLNRYPD